LQIVDRVARRYRGRRTCIAVNACPSVFCL
jgi:hypothetical protein